MKPCPFCAEPIQEAAIKCRHCGSLLVPSEGLPASPDLPPAGDPAVRASADEVGIPWLWLGVAAGALVLGAIALALLVRGSAAPPSEPAVVVPPAPEPYRFSEIAWGTPVNEVAAQLASRGFRFTEQDEEGDHVFQGVVDGRDAVVIAMLARGALAKTIVVLVGKNDAEQLFADTNRRLSERYGEPKVQAANGSSRPIARWPPHADAGGDTLMWSTITDQGDVAIHYESALWSEESQRRRIETQTRGMPLRPVPPARRVAGLQLLLQLPAPVSPVLSSSAVIS